MSSHTFSTTLLQKHRLDIKPLIINTLIDQVRPLVQALLAS